MLISAKRHSSVPAASSRNGFIRKWSVDRHLLFRCLHIYSSDIFRVCQPFQRFLCNVLTRFVKICNSSTESANFRLKIPYRESPGQPSAARDLGWFYFDCIVDSFMREWLVHQQEYRAGEITREEYFEWKLNWPDTCDDLGKVTPTIKWRKNK